jgi:hypothetical protein
MVRAKLFCARKNKESIVAMDVALVLAKTDPVLLTLRTLGLLSLLILVAGVAGGLASGMISGNVSFLRARTVTSSEGDVQQPGLLSNMVVGGLSAFASWALYGPLAKVNLLNIAGTAPEDIVFSLSSLGGAFIVGYGGAKWLSAEADKRILKKTSQVAATATASEEKSQEIGSASTPVDALEAAKSMPR